MTDKISKAKQLELNKIEARSNMVKFFDSVLAKNKVNAKIRKAVSVYIDERLNDFGNVPEFADSPDTWLVLAPNRVTRSVNRKGQK